MINLKSKKNMYLLFLFIISLLSVVIVPTYAKFSSSYTTENDIVALTLNYDLKLNSVEEFEEIVVPAGKVEVFNVKITNSTSSKLYYGIWYQLINDKNDGMYVGRMKGTITSTSESLNAGDSTVVSIVAINDNTVDNMKINIGVAKSDVGIGDIEYLNDRQLITGDLMPYDLIISSIKINGVDSNNLPTSGLYNMTYTCDKGSSLSWDKYGKNIIYDSSKTILRDDCSLDFKTDTDYLMLSEMTVGSYVDYVGEGGTVNGSKVFCKKNDGKSSMEENVATESPNSCYGENAREDLDKSGYTYGFCGNKNNKYYVSGWRIAYISNGNVYLISAGAPECILGSINNIKAFSGVLNASAIKYCNSKFVDGNCKCISNNFGQCDNDSSKMSGVWAINNSTFFEITNYISKGYGKKITNNASKLGVIGPNLDKTYCYGSNAYMECGYNNDLLDIGGSYFFDNDYGVDSKNFVFWNSNIRGIGLINKDYVSGLRPVIRLKSNVYVTGGAGTMDDPYTIGISS